MRLINTRWRQCAVAAVAAALAGGLALTVPAAGASEDTPEDARMDVYRSAADEFGVPLDVVLGVSYLDSRWDVNLGRPSTSGGFVPMHLAVAQYVVSLNSGMHEHHEDARGDDSRAEISLIDVETDIPEGELQTVDDAAALVGETVETLRTDVEANTHGGTA